MILQTGQVHEWTDAENLGYISRDAVREICTLIRNSLIADMPDSYFRIWDINDRLIDSGLEWVNVAPRGKIAKRIRGKIRGLYDLTLDDRSISIIGQMAQKHTSTDEIFRFDFTKVFNWVPGEFGDHGSCFWKARAGAREMLVNAGAYAVRFYDDGLNGTARAFILPFGNHVVVFNGYGMDTEKIAWLLSTWARESCVQVEFLNNEEWQGMLYINNSGTGYVIGEPKHDAIAHKVVDMLIPEVEGPCVFCVECGLRVPVYREPTLQDGHYFCEICFREMYRFCYECGHYKLIQYFSMTPCAKQICISQCCDSCSGKCYRKSQNNPVFTTAA